MIPFLERTWFFWWTIATVVILRWLHVISCNASHEALQAPDAGEEGPPSDVGTGPSRKHTPAGFGREHAY